MITDATFWRIKKQAPTIWGGRWLPLKCDAWPMEKGVSLYLSALSRTVFCGTQCSRHVLRNNVSLRPHGANASPHIQHITGGDATASARSSTCCATLPWVLRPETGMQFAASSLFSPHASTRIYCFSAASDSLASSLKMGPRSKGPCRLSCAVTSMWRHIARVANEDAESIRPMMPLSRRACLKAVTAVSAIRAR